MNVLKGVRSALPVVWWGYHGRCCRACSATRAAGPLHAAMRCMYSLPPTGAGCHMLGIFELVGVASCGVEDVAVGGRRPTLLALWLHTRTPSALWLHTQNPNT